MTRHARPVADRELKAQLAAGQVERGIDVAAAKQAEKTSGPEIENVQQLGPLWRVRCIQPRHKHRWS